MLLLFWRDRGPSQSSGLGVTYYHQVTDSEDNLYANQPVQNPASYAVPDVRSGVEYRHQSPSRGVP